MNQRLLAAVIFLVTSASAVALEDYKCTVKDAESLENNGLLEETSWSKLLNGQEFVIERATGKIVGGNGISNHNGKFGQPKVIDKGSSKQSYKVLTVYGPNVAVTYLQVSEFSSETEKPFLLMTNSTDVLSGTCVHF